MDQVILSRLKLFINKIESLIETGLAILHQMKNGDENVNLDEAQIVSNKLKSAIDRFVSELYYYYKMVEQPSVDILSSYTETQIKGEELISELNFLTRKKTQTDTDHGSKINSLNVTSKLPKMELAKFHGDVLQWHQFWDQFCSNVDSRNISDVDKLLYLQSALEGEAKSTIEGLDMTNKNYDIAVSTLKDRYGKPSLVIDAHYAALYRIKAADSSSIVDCRRVLNEIERHLRVLGSLGEDVNHNHLRFMILQKFSGDITYELRLKMDTTETGNIENLRRNLERIISARESSELMKKEVNLEQPSQKTANNNFTLETLHVGSETGRHTNFSVNERGKFVSKRHFPSKGGGHTKKIYNRKEERCFQGKNSNNSTKFDTRKRQHQQEESEPERKRKRPTCIFCGGGHFNDECKEARTIEERKRRLKGRCYNCLSKGHQSAECRSNMKCRHCGKYGEHNRALCPAKCQTKTDALHVNGPNGIKGVTALQTAIIYILKKGEEDKTLPCRVLLDCGSQRTYVTKELAKKFNLPELETNNLLVFTFGSDRPTELESPVVELNFHTRTNNHRRIYANVVPHITNRVPTVFDIVKKDIGSKDLTLADDASLGDRVDILIGNDYYFNFVNSQKKQISEHLYLVDTIFGWVWSGNFPVASEGKQDLLTVLTYFQSSIDCGGLNKPDLPLRSDDMKRLWDLESIGITESPKLTRDEDTIRQFNESTKFFDNRYQVKWPWIEYPPSLPSNFGLAYGRLNSLQKRLDNETAQCYDEILRDQLDKGIIEEVSNPKAPVDHPVHYLPHHCIKQGQKLRLVYDASSKIKDNKSLNECLYRGPLLLEDLTGLLIRFRSYRIGIVADVEKAFLQIGLQEEDRDVTRFLWPKDIDKPLTADNLSHFRFRRVPFGVISSPFLLNATVRYHLQKSNKRILKKIADDLYVDNLVSGTETIQEATNLYHSARCAFGEISMNLREWNSNSRDFLDSIPRLYRSQENKVMKVLGLNWDLEKDEICLKFDLEKHDVDNINTKREVLKLLASIFDPCGFVIPFVLSTKLFLQNLWHQKIKWDDAFSEYLNNEWRTALAGLGHIKSIKIPRYLKPEIRNDVTMQASHELHVFTDASMQAYAAAVYLRSVVEDQCCLKFIMGKSRLVEKDKQNDMQIPKLELLGALIGSRLIRSVLKSLRIQIDKLYLWTDSQIVVNWCHTEKLLPPFIARRVEEIKRNNELHIRYVPSLLNPADVATRPNAAPEDVQRWLKGPNFLYKEIGDWPATMFYSDEIDKSIQNLSVGQGPTERETQDHYVQRSSSERTNTLSETEYRNIELDDKVIDILRAQKQCFLKELKGEQTSLARSLGIFKDEQGLLRCGGRLGNTDWMENQKHPILLPSNHDFTTKVIEETHKQNYHVGVSHTLSQIRKRFWIPQGRRQVQKVLKGCLSCRKYSGGPYRLPPMAQLPAHRVTYSDPFTYIGLDYFGPVLTPDKRWVALFTCMAVRAIHMEVVSDMSAEECSLALRRFVATRGVPKLITSDNALQFKLTAEVLTSDYCISNGIKWKFIPELAPWFGGYYERLIAIVKNCLKRTIDKHMLNHVQLTTIIKEVEAVVNSRPLTVVSDELEHILTPADFLRTGGVSLPERSDTEFLERATITKSNLIEGWKRGQVILREYIEMFQNHYLTSLRDRRTTHRQPRTTVDAVPKVGDVVQVKGDSSRALWKVGRISAVVKGDDGNIRVAKVTISPNEILTRSISHLYPLEIQNHDTDKRNHKPTNLSTRPHPQTDSLGHDAQDTCEELTPSTSSGDLQGGFPQNRPKRQAAQTAREKLKEWTSQLLNQIQL